MLFRLVQSGNCEGITTAFKRTHIRINNSLDFLSPLDFALAATVASCAANPSQAKFGICTHNYVNTSVSSVRGSPTCWTADQSKPTQKLRFPRCRRYRYNGRLDFAQTWQIKRLSSWEWINNSRISFENWCGPDRKSCQNKMKKIQLVLSVVLNLLYFVE